MKKLLLGVGLVALVAIVGMAVHELSRSAHRQAAFARVQKGQTEAAIVAAMGQPDRVATFVPYLLWDDSDIRPNRGVAVKEYQYGAFPMGEWVIGFDASGGVVSKYYKQSP